MTSSLKMHADLEGKVRFFVRSDAPSERHAYLFAQCDIDKKSILYAIELVANANPTKAMPAPAEQTAVSRTVQARSALSEKEASTLSDHELLKRGYPPRPDGKGDSKAYLTWLKIVTRPATLIPPQLAYESEIVHSPVQATFVPFWNSSINWSGYALSGGAPYDVVNGRWAIPPAIGELPGVSYTYSLLWLGLDGYGTADVVQAGTGQDGFVLPGVFPTDPAWVVSSYYAWTETYPLPLQRITNFHVDPGDDIFSAVWVGNPGEAPSVDGTFGFFQMEDLTKSHYTVIGTPIPPGITFTGSSAEWIMERPKLGNYFPPLANYGSASMSNAYAHRAGGPWIPYGGDTNTEFWMFEGSDLLSTVSPVDLSSMTFSWHNFH